MSRIVRRSLAARGPRTPRRGAFTVVEMIVVIAVIALILAIGVPAFNSMTVQQRASKARQLLNGTLTRTHVISLSDRNLAAVRVCPAQWNLGDEAGSATLAGRQIITTYSYRHTAAANPYDPNQVRFADRFERIENGPTQLLPPDTWVAPGEALLDADSGDLFESDDVLAGAIGLFTLDATDTSQDLLPADDFLIVFDPETGVQTQRPDSQNWRAWHLLAFDPRPARGESQGVATGQLETDGLRRPNGSMQIPFQRYNFSGVVVYRREPFEALGADAEPDDRRDVLRRLGQTYYVNRTGGNLVAGAGEATEGG